jgi:hypothetical protein
LSFTLVEIENGKYQFVVSEGKISIRRFGKEWIEDFSGPGTKAVMGLIFEHEELKSKYSVPNCDRLREELQNERPYGYSQEPDRSRYDLANWVNLAHILERTLGAYKMALQLEREKFLRLSEEIQEFKQWDEFKGEKK